MPVTSLDALVIDPTAIYHDDSSTAVLRISSAAMAKARRDGSLRYSVRGGRNFYLGAWLIEWVERGEVRIAQPDSAALAVGA